MYRIIFITVFLLLFLVMIIGGINDKNTITRASHYFGEPIPGAEIYVELEPDDEPIAFGQTGEDGTFHFSPTRVGRYKFYFIMREDIIKPKVERIKKTDHLGTYHFKVSLQNGRRSAELNFAGKKATAISNHSSTMKGLMKTVSGPYSESLSNIEDPIVVRLTVEPGPISLRTPAK